MDRPGHLLEDKALANFLGLEDVGFDSGNDIKVEGEERSKPSTPVRGDIPHPTPNPFPERSATTALTALGAMSPMDTSGITNPLDEEQQRMLDQAASARSNVTPYFGNMGYRPETKTPTELECLKALREKCLEPTLMTMSQYRERLQSRPKEHRLNELGVNPSLSPKMGTELRMAICSSAECMAFDASVACTRYAKVPVWQTFV
uniref:Uncharacterized protein n=1 Tax=Peronospora matthiolae TaxID=2874970 RepID=A0AAV1TNI0_9STRA